MNRVHYTAAEVEALIDAARAHVMTPDEREAQRRSFVHGTVAESNPAVTRELVDEVADAPVKCWIDSWWALPAALVVLVAFFAAIYSVASNGAREHVEVAK